MRRIGLLFLIFIGLLRADAVIVYFTGEVYHFLPVKDTKVTVNIQEQVATTTVKHTFENKRDEIIDINYFIPLPVEASVTGFSVFKGGEWHEYSLVEGGRNQGDTTGESKEIPGLNKYLGENSFSIKIDSIFPNEVDTIKLEYTEFLPYDMGVVTYYYPLYTPPEFISSVLSTLNIDISLHSSRKILEVSSPFFSAEIQQIDSFNYTISYSNENFIPDTNFIIQYRLSQKGIGVYLYTYRDAEKDGYYMIILEPSQLLEPDSTVPKNFVFVFDRSGSMDGVKIQQAKDAAIYCIDSLVSHDYFNVIRYNYRIDTCFTEIVQATQENKSIARDWIENTEATGGTDINDALLTALDQWVEEGIENQIIFLTDGLPTVGETNTEQILQNVKEANDKDFRIFCFGVGNDVDGRFLERLSFENNGITVLVREDQSVDSAVAYLFDRIAFPVMSNPHIDYGSIETYDIYPPEIPSIAYGSQVLIFGRYKNSGRTDISVTGKAKGKDTTITLEDADFPQLDTTWKFLPRSWAKSKIDYWIRWMKAYGEVDSIIKMIVDLSLEYGILTPYTHYEDTSGVFEKMITNLTAVYKEDKIYLSWNLREINADFVIRIERSNFRNGPFQLLEELPYNTRSYVDKDVKRGEIYFYKVSIFLKGDLIAYEIIEVDTEKGMLTLQDVSVGILSADKINCKFSLRKDAFITIDILDVTGKKVRTILNKRMMAGEYKLEWDARALSSGIYFLSFKTEDENVIRKVLLIK